MPPRRRSKPRSPEHAALGLAVEELRRERKLTQEEFADRIDSEFQPIGRLERGLSNPTFSSLLRIANGFGMELSELAKRYERHLRKRR